eukprot:Gb_14285 [translate_table: standard]
MPPLGCIVELNDLVIRVPLGPARPCQVVQRIRELPASSCKTPVEGSLVIPSAISAWRDHHLPMVEVARSSVGRYGSAHKAMT